MSAQASLLDQLLEPGGVGKLVTWLRAHDHEIDIAQISDLQYLFMNLREAGAELDSSEELGRWMVPVLGKTPATIETLKKDIDSWWQQRELLAADTGAKPDTDNSVELKSLPRAPRKRRSRRALVITGALFAILATAFVADWVGPLLITNGGGVPDTVNPGPQEDGFENGGDAPGSSSGSSLITQIRTIWGSIPSLDTLLLSVIKPADRLLLYLLLLAASVWLWRRALAKHAVLQRRAGADPRQSHRYHFQARVPDLLAEPSILNRMRDMRIPQLLRSRKLDVPASVVATRKAGGFITLCEQQNSVTPEYVLLIERRSAGDHMAELGAQIHRRLIDEHIFSDRYEFHMSPRRFLKRSQETEEVRRSLSLDEIVSAHARQRLIIVSDGGCFIDELTEQPFDWITDFMRLPVRVVLTPNAQELWGSRERELIEAGFYVLPATHQGIETLIDLLAGASLGEFKPQPALMHRPAARRGRAVPHFISDNRERLVADEDSLDDNEKRKLMRALRGYLRRKTLLWLMTCAVFPRLTPRLTLHLGAVVTDARGEPLCDITEQETYLALARLPWFQEGHMPDWLRQMLMRAMPEGLQPRIVEVLTELLESGKLTRSEGGLELDLVENDAVKAKQPESPVDDPGLPRDYLFLGFMNNDPLESLSIEVPPSMRRRMRRRLFRKPAIATLVAATVALFAAMFWPQQRMLPVPDAGLDVWVLSLALLALGIWLVDRFAGTRLPKSLMIGLRAMFFIVMLSATMWVANDMRKADVGEMLIVSVGVATLLILLVVGFDSKHREPTAGLRYRRIFGGHTNLANFMLWYIVLASCVELLVPGDWYFRDNWEWILWLSLSLIGVAGAFFVGLTPPVVRRIAGMLWPYLVLYLIAMALLISVSIYNLLAGIEFSIGSFPIVLFLIMLVADFQRSQHDLVGLLLPWLLLSMTLTLITELAATGMPFYITATANGFCVLMLTLPVVAWSRRRELESGFFIYFGKQSWRIFLKLLPVILVEMQGILYAALPSSALGDTGGFDRFLALLFSGFLLRNQFREIINGQTAKRLTLRMYLLTMWRRIPVPVKAWLGWAGLAAVTTLTIATILEDAEVVAILLAVGSFLFISGHAIYLFRKRRDQTGELFWYWLVISVTVFYVAGASTSVLISNEDAATLTAVAAVILVNLYRIVKVWSEQTMLVSCYWLIVTASVFLAAAIDGTDTMPAGLAFLVMLVSITFWLLRRKRLHPAEAAMYWLQVCAGATVSLTMTFESLDIRFFGLTDDATGLLIGIVATFVSSALLLGRVRKSESGLAVGFYWIGFMLSLFVLVIFGGEEMGWYRGDAIPVIGTIGVVASALLLGMMRYALLTASEVAIYALGFCFSVFGFFSLSGYDAESGIIISSAVSLAIGYGVFHWWVFGRLREREGAATEIEDPPEVTAEPLSEAAAARK